MTSGGNEKGRKYKSIEINKQKPLLFWFCMKLVHIPILGLPK